MKLLTLLFVSTQYGMIRHSLAGSRDCLTWPLTLLPVRVLEANSCSVKRIFASSIPTCIGAVSFGLVRTCVCFLSTEETFVACTSNDRPFRSVIGSLLWVDATVQWLLAPKMLRSSLVSLSKMSLWNASTVLSCCSTVGVGSWGGVGS